MDVLIRDVQPMFVNELDKQAEIVSDKTGRKFSRNDYIKMLIQNDCEMKLVRLKEDKFDEAVTNLSTTLRRQEKTLQEFINSNNRLFHLIASGTDMEKGVDEL